MFIIWSNVYKCKKIYRPPNLKILICNIIFLSPLICRFAHLFRHVDHEFYHFPPHHQLSLSRFIFKHLSLVFNYCTRDPQLLHVGLINLWLTVNQWLCLPSCVSLWRSSQFVVFSAFLWNVWLPTPDFFGWFHDVATGIFVILLGVFWNRSVSLY